MATWGLVSTILAPTEEVLRFAAYHLELGAHRLFIYLDDANEDTHKALKTHPKIRVIRCDETYWKRRGGRPDTHQVRQTKNANHAYRRKEDIDWLAHIDVDEFLVPERSVSAALGEVPATARVARTRPMEQLAGGDGTAYKAFLPQGPQHMPTLQRLYPNFAEYLRGGFLSHSGGKIFLRKGLQGVHMRIHNAFEGPLKIEDGAVLDDVPLAHRHAQSWAAWQARYRYRLAHGSYRPGLDRKRTRNNSLSLHDLFTYLEDTQGEAGLRAFHDEVAADTPALRARLEAEGLLRIVPLDLETPRQTQF